MWSIKIFDNEEPAHTAEVLDLAERWGAGVECALYGSIGFGPEVDARLRAKFAGNPRHALGLHLHHGSTSLVELSLQDWSGPAIRRAMRAPALGAAGAGEALIPEGLSYGAWRVAREAAWARGVGCRSAVIHVDRGNPLEKGSWLRLAPREFAGNCVPAIDAAAELGLRLHLEKTYESRAWLDEFYAEIARRGRAHLFGFAFDLGHSRVWAREPLGNWLASIERLREAGFGLHFHLHGNPGDVDRHETLSKSQALGWLDPDPEWAPDGAMEPLRRIQALYEDKAMLVLENGSREARENLDWVELAMRG